MFVGCRDTKIMYYNLEAYVVRSMETSKVDYTHTKKAREREREREKRIQTVIIFRQNKTNNQTTVRVIGQMMQKQSIDDYQKMIAITITEIYYIST